MQQKRLLQRWKLVLAVLAGVGLVALIVLANLPIPAPQQIIEKPLDAKAFLESKQP